MIKIEKWEPLPNIPSKLYLEGLHDDYEGFRVLLKGEAKSNRMLRIYFPTHLAYRNVDETNRLKTLVDYPILATMLWSLFVSKDDDFINWVATESAGIICDTTQYRNYIIATPNDIVEIISNEEPIIEWL